jgi:hypothetical protein
LKSPVEFSDVVSMGGCDISLKILFTETSLGKVLSNLVNIAHVLLERLASSGARVSRRAERNARPDRTCLPSG